MKAEKLENRLKNLALKPNKTDYENGLLKQYTEEYIDRTKNLSFISFLGALLEEKGDYDTALYYYEEAYYNGIEQEAYFVAKIYYYGHSSYGFDYKKAFKYFKIASNTKAKGEGTFADALLDTHIDAKYMMATMYRDGLGVRQSYKKYYDILLKLMDEFDEIMNEEYYFLYLDTYAKVCRENARVCLENNDFGMWVEYLGKAIDALSELIIGTVETCEKDDLEDLSDALDEWYTYLDPHDPGDIDMMHCLYLLKQPTKLSFIYRRKTYYIESKIMEDKLEICFDGNQIFDNPIDMYLKAKVGKRYLSSIAMNTKDWQNLSAKTNELLN